MLFSNLLNFKKLSFDALKYMLDLIVINRKADISLEIQNIFTPQNNQRT